MKINQNGLPPNTEANSSKKSAINRATAVDQASQESPPTRSHDSVQLSDEARALQKAQNSISNASQPFQHAKVDALKTAIDNGSYDINAERIADSLLADEQLF